MSMANKMYDLVIIGGGPAGAAAGVYAARKKVRSVLITEEWGGQSTVSPDIQNWIGEVSLRGVDMANKLKKHLEAVKADMLDIVESDRVIEVSKEQDGFKVATDDGKNFKSKAIFRSLKVASIGLFSGRSFLTNRRTWDRHLWWGTGPK